MTELLKIILVFTFLLTPVLAQEPPPPPVIYKAPNPGDIKEFVSEEGGFKISFPGTPLIAKRELENRKVINIRLRGKASNAAVNTTVFSINVENQREQIYEIVRNNLLKTPKTKIAAERDITIEGKPAKEFHVSRDIFYLKMRVVITGNKFFELISEITNWHIIGEPTKKEFFNETERFFNSFKFLLAPQNQTVADFFGENRNSVYQNNFFGFSIPIPSGWEQLSENNLVRISETNSELLRNGRPAGEDAFQHPASNEVLILTLAIKNDPVLSGTNLVVFASRQSEGITSQMIASRTKRDLVSEAQTMLVRDVTSISINGVEFSVFEIETVAAPRKLIQRYYATIRRGHSLSFVATSHNQEGKKRLEKLMRSLTFKTQ